MTNESEFRIYTSGGTANYTSLFRIFKDKSEKWKAGFYEHYAKVQNNAELHTEKRIPISENNTEFVFHNLSGSHILYLPSLKDQNQLMGLINLITTHK